MGIDKPKVNINESIVADILKQDIFNNLNCVQIGEIVSFNATNQTAMVQIKIKRKLQTGEEIDYTPLVDCPVFCLSGSMGGIDIPINKGDTCIILFNDRSIDEWWATNQNQYPKIYRTHNFNDGLILVGIRSLQNLIANYINTATKVWYNNNNMIMTDNLTVFNNPVKANGYKSSDGSNGITTTQTIEIGGNVTKTMTIKNGIIVGIS